jgi:hypothetical protein
MAKPIKIGLVLEGEDAPAFLTYIRKPDDTPAGRKMMEEALLMAKSEYLK